MKAALHEFCAGTRYNHGAIVVDLRSGSMVHCTVSADVNDAMVVKFTTDSWHFARDNIYMWEILIVIVAYV